MLNAAQRIATGLLQVDDGYAFMMQERMPNRVQVAFNDPRPEGHLFR